MRKCPRCSCELNDNAKACPKCGLSTVKMDAFLQSMNIAEYNSQNKMDPSEYLKLSSQERAALRREKKLRKKEEKRAKKIRESVSDTDFSQFATNTDEYRKKVRGYQNNFFGRRQRAKDRSKTPEFTIDPNGEFNIDTSDVELVGEQTGRIIEEQHQSYSIKKSRGDYRPPKIKWWEIYKLADRHFARKKIKKQISKASKIKPGFISKTKLFLLALFLGWTGAHNFYAKNYKKGFFSIGSLLFFILIMVSAQYSAFIASIQLSIGGLAGFLNMFIWISDTISIGFNSFKYRIQKEAFLFRLNFNTRAKLGERYYDLELYQKPWWTRFAVWCKRRKRELDEAIKEHRQNKIEKQKRKTQQAQQAQAEPKEQDKGKASGTFAAQAESTDAAQAKGADTVQTNGGSAAKSKKAKIESEARGAVSSEMMREINSYDGGKTEAVSGDEAQGAAKGHATKRQAKASFSTKKKGTKKKN